MATRIAEKLITESRLLRRTESPVIYAVWLRGHPRAAYIGQSLNGYRRLWDLAIGESHHLANTFPPETWGSVAILRWADILGQQIESLSDRIGNHEGQARFLAGLAFEHLFLQRVQPLFNCYKRNRSGVLLPVDLSKSRGRGARFAPTCSPFAEPLFQQWEALCAGIGKDFPFAVRVLLDAC